MSHSFSFYLIHNHPSALSGCSHCICVDFAHTIQGQVKTKWFAFCTYLMCVHTSCTSLILILSQYKSYLFITHFYVSLWNYCWYFQIIKYIPLMMLIHKTYLAVAMATNIVSLEFTNHRFFVTIIMGTMIIRKLRWLAKGNVNLIS